MNPTQFIYIILKESVSMASQKNTLPIRNQNFFVRQRSDFDWESDSLKYMVLDNDVEKLNEIISELINEKPEYCQFINNISVCHYDLVAERIRYLRPVAVDLLELATRDNLNDEEFIVNKLLIQTFDIVTFTEFGMSELPDVLSFMKNLESNMNSDDRQYPMTTRPNYLRYDSDSADDRFFKEFCFNINPEFNYIPKKSNITFEHVKKVLVSNKTTISAEELMFVGPANILAAISFFNGTFLIRWSTFKSYLEEFGKNIVKDLLRMLFDRFVFHLLKNHGRNIANMEEYVKNRVLSSLTKEHCRDITNHFDFKTNDKALPALNSLLKYIEDQTKYLVAKQMNDDRNVLYFKSELYDSLLKKIFKKVLTQINTSKNISFLEGLKCGKMFERLGWSYVDDSKEIPGNVAADESKLWWKKTVEFSPDRFCYCQKIYQISDDKKGLIVIHTLYVCSNGEVRAKETFNKEKLRYGHPNIGSASNVCLGDLRLADSLLKVKSSDFENFLNNVSTFLQMINFDSPYCASDRDFFYKDSKLMYEDGRKRDGDGKVVAASPGTTYKKIKAVINNVPQAPDAFTIRTDNIKEIVPAPAQIKKFVFEYTDVDVSAVLGILTTLERTRSVYSDKSIDWNSCSVWLHPNGTSYFYLSADSYGRCFYQKNKYSFVYQLDIEKEFNICIKICRLIKVGKLFDCYKYYLTKDNIERFINPILKKDTLRDITITDIVSNISYMATSKEIKPTDVKEEDGEEKGMKGFNICKNIPNPVVLDFAEFFNKVESTTDVVMK